MDGGGPDDRRPDPDPSAPTPERGIPAWDPAATPPAGTPQAPPPRDAPAHRSTPQGTPPQDTPPHDIPPAPSASTPPGPPPRQGPPPGTPGDPWGFGGPVRAPRPGVVPLRPLALGELLDGSLSTIRAHPRLVLGTAAVLAVISELLQLPVRLALGDVFAPFLDTTSGTLPSTAQLSSAVAGISAVGGISGVINLLVTTVLTGLLMVVVGRSVLGAPVQAADCWRAARERLLGLLGVVVLSALVGVVVTAVCAVPALLAVLAGAGLGVVLGLGVLGLLVALVALVAVSTLLSLAAPAYVLEGVGVVAALRRSLALARPRFWPVLGTLVVTWLIVTVVAGILSVPFSLLSGLVTGVSAAGTGQANPFGLVPQLFTSLGTIIALALTAPFQAGVTGLLYVDQRMRREGFDIELRRAAGGWS